MRVLSVWESAPQPILRSMALHEAYSFDHLGFDFPLTKSNGEIAQEILRRTSSRGIICLNLTG